MARYIPPALRNRAAAEAADNTDNVMPNLTLEQQLPVALGNRRIGRVRQIIAQILQRTAPIRIAYTEGNGNIDISLGQGATDAGNSGILNLVIGGTAQFPRGPLVNPSGHLHFYNPGQARMAMGVRIDFYFIPQVNNQFYGNPPIKFNIRIDPNQYGRDPQIRLTLDRENIGRGTTEIARSPLSASRGNTLGVFNIQFNEALKKADNGIPVNRDVRRSDRISDIDSDSLRNQLSYLLDAFTGLELDVYTRFTGAPGQGFQLGGKKSRKTRKVRKKIKNKRKTNRVRKSRKKIKSRKSRKNKKSSKSRKSRRRSSVRRRR